MTRIAAILPAAGLGTRMGAETPKQFLELEVANGLIQRGQGGQAKRPQRSLRRADRHRTGQRASESRTSADTTGELISGKSSEKHGT